MAARMVNILRREGCRPADLPNVIQKMQSARGEWEELVTDSIAVSPVGPSEYDRFACIDAAWRLEQMGLARTTITDVFCTKTDDRLLIPEHSVREEGSKEVSAWRLKVARVWRYATPTSVQ